jgi:hypothetical protein
MTLPRIRIRRKKIRNTKSIRKISKIKRRKRKRREKKRKRLKDSGKRDLKGKGRRVTEWSSCLRVKGICEYNH